MIGFTSFYSSIFIASLLLMAVLTANAQDKVWWKGNLHTHSLWSDGDDYPEMIMDWYKSNGYDFVALSDHNILAEGEKWINVSRQVSQEQIFKDYLEKFGEEWVDHKQSDEKTLVRLKTLEEYRKLFEKPGEFLIIKSEEITDRYGNKPIHINATNIQKLILPRGGNSVKEVMQNNIDAVLAQREATGVPMFPHLNHPNFGWGVTMEDIMGLSGERFFEIYNGHPLVHNEGDSLHPGTEEMWDKILTHYLKNGKPPIYGLATDDSHNYHIFGDNKSNPGRGWLMVRAKELSAVALIDAMEKGDFYSSTGVELEKLHFAKGQLQVAVKEEENISYTILFYGSRGDETGMLLKEVKGTQANYELKEGDLYVRAKIISDQLKENPYQEGEFEVAWTQPYLK